MNDSSNSPTKRQDGETLSAWEERVRRIRRDTVHEVLEAFGFNAEDVTEIQKDIAFLRRLRKTSEQVSAKTMIGFVGLFFTVLGLAAAWLFNQFGNPKP